MGACLLVISINQGIARCNVKHNENVRNDRVHTVIISCCIYLGKMHPFQSNPEPHSHTHARMGTLCTTEQASITTLINKVCVGRYDAFENQHTYMQYRHTKIEVIQTKCTDKVTASIVQ